MFFTKTLIHKNANKPINEIKKNKKREKNGGKRSVSEDDRFQVKRKSVDVSNRISVDFQREPRSKPCAFAPFSLLLRFPPEKNNFSSVREGKKLTFISPVNRSS